MTKKVPMTVEGAKRLKAELHRLKTVDRPTVIAAIGLTGMRELVPYAIQSLHELLHSQGQSDRSRTASADVVA